jgi:Glycosyl hydrolase family 26
MKTGKNWGLLGQTLALITLSVALAGCGGSSDAGSASSTAAGASATPSVSGTPTAVVAAENHYSFQPTLVNPSGMPVSFSIVNKPVWATFGAGSGELSGTPATPDTGSYDNIVISASDGSTSSALPAFSIKVVAAGTTVAASSSSSGASSSSSGSSSSATTASASGTMIPSATQIVDSAHNVWTVVGGSVKESGVAAGFTANVSLVLYYGGTIYQENTACLWWSWTGGAWVTTSNPAPSITPACSSSTAAANVTSPSSSSGASSATGSAATLLAYLNGLKAQTKHVLIGQHTSYWDANVLDVEQAAASQTGKPVSILGTTTGMVGSTEDGVGVSNTWLAQGGIVEVSWWPVDPITGSYSESSPMSASNFASLTVPGSAGYVAWHKLLDIQVALLKQINGPVIYRPMLEMNGNWSWWQDQDPATYVLLWQQMHDYYVAQGVTNVLYFFCPNWGEGGNYLAYYAGASYVDIVGVDEYANTPGTNITSDGAYSQLTGTGKPFMIGEAGIGNGDNSSITPFMGSNDSYLQSVQQNAPLVVGITFFCQNWAISEQNGAAALMNEPTTLAMSDLPAGIVSP